MGFERTIRPKGAPAPPARAPRLPRPFSASVPEPPREAPSLEAQERAAAFGHNFGRLPAPSGPGVVQLCKDKQGKKRKQAPAPKKTRGTTAPTRDIASYFNAQPAPAPLPRPVVPSSSSSSEEDGGPRKKARQATEELDTEELEIEPDAPLPPPPRLASIFQSPRQQREDRERHQKEQAEREKRRALIEARKHSQLDNVPDDWIAATAHNPGGPPVRLQPPRHTGPSEASLAEPDPLAHVIDLSTGQFSIFQGKDQPEKVYNIDREGEDGDETRSDVRNYVTLTNEHLRQTGPLIPQATNRKERGSLGSQATAISSAERRQHESAYGSKIVGHAPDPSVSGVSHSPLGFLPLTSDANSIVGHASGIGLRAYRKDPISHFLVREQGLEGPELHHYRLPERQREEVDAPSTSSSSLPSPSPAPPPLAPAPTFARSLTPPSHSSPSLPLPARLTQPVPPQPAPAPPKPQLTQEQRERIERSKQEALARREALRRQREGDNP